MEDTFLSGEKLKSWLKWPSQDKRIENRIYFSIGGKIKAD